MKLDTPDPAPRLLRLQRFSSWTLDHECESDSEPEATPESESDSKSWEILSDEPSASTPIDEAPPVPGIDVQMVSELQDEDYCSTCEMCDQLIGPGSTMVTWQAGPNAIAQYVHAACCICFALSQGIALKMMHALVDFQPLAEPSLQSLINLLLHEILDRTDVHFQEHPVRRQRPIQMDRPDAPPSATSGPLGDTLVVGSPPPTDQEDTLVDTLVIGSPPPTNQEDTLVVPSQPPTHAAGPEETNAGYTPQDVEDSQALT